MLDARLRRVAGPYLDAAGEWLADRGVRPIWLTGAGFVLGSGACVAIGLGRFDVALGLWLANRALDALDGPTARAQRPSELGAFLDILGDFSIYSGFVLALAVEDRAARLACVALLVTYSLSGTAFLACSSLLERRRSPSADERSLHFVGGLAEGSETAVVYVLFCLLPGSTSVIAWGFAGMVGLTTLQRVLAGVRILSRPVAGEEIPAQRPRLLVDAGAGGEDPGGRAPRAAVSAPGAPTGSTP